MGSTQDDRADGGGLPSELSGLEREIVDDIRAACARFGWPVDERPCFRAYLDRRGHLYEKDIKRLGGWKRLCALGGMHPRAADPPAWPAGGNAAQRAAKFAAFVADAREVAQALRLKSGARLTHAAYRRAGGLFGTDIAMQVGGWTAVSAAAGFPSGKGGTRVPARRRWQKTEAASMTRAEFDAALARVHDAPSSRGVMWTKGVCGRRGARVARPAAQESYAAGPSAGGLPVSSASASGWGVWEAARAMGVGVDAILEKYRKAPPPGPPSPYPDPDRPGVYRVPLTGQEAAGREAIVDAESVPLLGGGRFHVASTGSRTPGGEAPGSIYVSVHLPDGTYTPLRRVVMGVVAGDVEVKVGHVNGDPLDCRRGNLVVRTTGEHAQRASKFGSRRGRACSSRFKGVCWNRRERTWVAQIRKDGRRRHLGTFADEIAAATAYDAAARELFGEHAYQNFPDGVDAFLTREAAAAAAADTGENAHAHADANADDARAAA